MSKYYRFISKEEYKNLIDDEKITSLNRPLFILPEFPTAYILPEELNYNLTIEELRLIILVNLTLQRKHLCPT